MKRLWNVLAIVFGLSAAAGPALASPAAQAPGQTSLLPDDASGMVKVAVQFDLSSYTSAGDVDEAILEWTVPGVPSDELSEFTAYPVTDAWSATGVVQGSTPDLGETPVAHWTIEPPDYEHHGGLVRLDVTQLARSWAAGETPNHGVVIELEGVSRTGLSSALSSIRLKIR
jgi:hypothetical protein